MKSEEFTKYANSFQSIAKPGLDNIRRLMHALGNPEKKLKFIHVAGTNGKGSVCAYLQSILTEAGFKTGKYISPNMISVCERISVDGEMITQSELDSILETVRKSALDVQAQSGICPTQFEIWTAAAFLYFLKKDCDIVILETGLGGRLDATNIIPAPLISIITHIAMDHMQYLGNTLCEIAAEKAGIIKDNPNGCTISAAQSKDVIDVLEKAAFRMHNKFTVTQKAVSEGFDSECEVFSYRHLKNLRSSMLGLHQLDNAAAAIDAALFLNIDECAIRSGVKKARNIGRFEIVSKAPLTVFDGAHNPDGMNTLKNALLRYFPDKSKSFIMASMADKDISASLEIIKSMSDFDKCEFFTVSVNDNPRSMSAADLSALMQKHGISAAPEPDIKSALSAVSKDMTVICGSLYIYKDYSEI